MASIPPMPPVHVALRDLVTEQGERILEDASALATALDPLLAAGEVTADQAAALTAAVRGGAFERMIGLLQSGADADAAVRTAADELARQDRDVASGRWALSVLAFTVDQVADEQVPLWIAKRPPAPDEAIFDGDVPSSGHGRRRRSGCLPILVVGIVFLAILGWFGRGMIADVKDMFAGPEDYPGPGSGEVSVTVDPGQSIASMGAELEDLGVVASSDAFVDAARAKPDETIQAATYLLKKEMKASDAFAFMSDPANAGQGNTVTVPEGSRVGQVVEAIVKKTDFTEKQLTTLLDNPERIGLPPEAEGNPEGYLFPATYEITDRTTPRSLLSQMVEQTVAVEKDLRIGARAEALGLTAHELITVASILEYEANRGEDYPKVARVIYNRLDDGMALQLDSTVSYVSQREGDVWTTQAERESDSLYNTYQHTGLPPGPIGSPGRETIEAALNPADGPWLYFVPDFEAGTTLFTDDYQEHLANAERAKEYCRTHEEC